MVSTRIHTGSAAAPARTDPVEISEVSYPGTVYGLLLAENGRSSQAMRQAHAVCSGCSPHSLSSRKAQCTIGP